MTVNTKSRKDHLKDLEAKFSERVTESFNDGIPHPELGDLGREIDRLKREIPFEKKFDDFINESNEK